MRRAHSLDSNPALWGPYGSPADALATLVSTIGHTFPWDKRSLATIHFTLSRLLCRLSGHEGAEHDIYINKEPPSKGSRRGNTPLNSVAITTLPRFTFHPFHLSTQQPPLSLVKSLNDHTCNLVSLPRTFLFSST